MLNSAQEILQQRKIEDRLSDRELTARLNFVLKAMNLFIQVGHSRVRADAYRRVMAADFAETTMEVGGTPVMAVRPFRLSLSRRPAARPMERRWKSSIRKPSPYR